ncbi:MAG TPA: LysM peptidoglycan-binding domain-containing protein, partial [Flavobacteriales bacterium]|nr:LysM peptidoglycan-binding domain-containing protein [Flavobacteriales bacterium]
YTVKKGQTILDIAEERLINEYMIVSVNPGVDDYNDVSEGQKIKIPVVYVKKSILYIDKINYLPIKQVMYDDKGLFEEYEFLNLKVNSTIYEEEFTEGYKDYNF